MRKRPIKISVRLNEQEHEHLKQQAALSGYPMEPFVRALIMGTALRPRPPDELPALLRQLSGIGNNINQIAKVANACGYARKEDLQQIMELQTQLWQAVKRL